MERKRQRAVLISLISEIAFRYGRKMQVFCDSELILVN